MELAQVVVVILVMVVLMEDMDKAAMNLNTNARDLMKPNAIPHHALSHRIIVRIGIRKCVSLKKGLSLSRLRNTSTSKNVDLFQKPYVIMLTKSSLKLVVFHLLERSVPT